MYTCIDLGVFLRVLKFVLVVKTCILGIYVH